LLGSHSKDFARGLLGLASLSPLAGLNMLLRLGRLFARFRQAFGGGRSIGCGQLASFAGHLTDLLLCLQVELTGGHLRSLLGFDGSELLSFRQSLTSFLASGVGL
jgi:hypothetical protein